MKTIYEKLGLFYLGKDIDNQSFETEETLTLLKNKNLTTHAAIIGMTGSGKTGLGISIIEEAAIDNIPSIIIDPKGDMGNLCLLDSNYEAKSFEPWVADEAKAKGENPLDYAQSISSMWKEGIEAWGQDSQRASKLQAVTKTIYTPGSAAGVAINVMSSLETPSREIMEESDLFSAYLKSTAVSLLSLIGISSDAVDSKEYILLAQIITKAWIKDESISVEILIGKIIKPSFTKIGVLPLEDFYPKDERFKLASKFNALLASPGFSLWLQGENLDIQKLLYDEQGKAKVAIFSIAHLNDDERMFFVTLLLNTYIAWMRRQSGTSALKTLLYMDEIYGFFPPTKNPPSKEPMLLLLKQARAFGVGVILSTQNPVDLDYKGLSNIGTWFIGRLQTAQDIDRVIDGLEGKVGSDLSKKEIKNILSNLEKRTFFLKSAHLENIRLFSTRWVLSYLKGPLKKDEISSLMEEKKRLQNISVQSIADIEEMSEKIASYQDIDDSILQYFEPSHTSESTYQPNLSAKISLHYYQERRSINESRIFERHLSLSVSSQTIAWEDAIEEEIGFDKFPHKKPAQGKFYSLPQIILDDKGLKKSIRELKESLYRTEFLTIYRTKSPKLESKVGESESDFKVSLQDYLDNEKEEDITKLQERYAKKEKTLLTRLSRAKERVEKEAADSTGSMIDAGIAVLGALFGRTTSTKVGRAFKKGTNILKERGDMSRATERMSSIEEDIETLTYELEDKVDALNEKFDIDNCEIETLQIKARKSDIDVEMCAVVWKLV